MARIKKLQYGEHEKKGLSQARNKGTDRLMKKIKEHASVTGHKVRYTLFCLKPWLKKTILFNKMTMVTYTFIHQKRKLFSLDKVSVDLLKPNSVCVAVLGCLILSPQTFILIFAGAG